MENQEFKPGEYRENIADDLKKIEDHNERRLAWEQIKQNPSYEASRKYHLEEVGEVEIKNIVDNLYKTFETNKHSMSLWDKTAEIEKFLSGEGKTPEEKLTNEILFEIFGKFSPNIVTEKNSCFCGGGGKAMEHASELMKKELKELMEKRKEIIQQYQSFKGVQKEITYLQLNSKRYVKLLSVFLKERGITANEDRMLSIWDVSVNDIEALFKRLLSNTSSTK